MPRDASGDWVPAVPMQPAPAPAPDRPATARSLGKQLCAALGIDPGNVTAIRLDLSAGEVAQVAVTRLFTQQQGLAVCELLTERFDLVPRDEVEREAVRPAGRPSGSAT